MKYYIVKVRISAECEDDARELVEEYTGQETDVEILEIQKCKVISLKGGKIKNGNRAIHIAV